MRTIKRVLETKAPDVWHVKPGDSVFDALKLMAEKNASDLFFTPKAPIKIKIEGKIMSLGKDLLTVDQVRDAAVGIMTGPQTDQLDRELEVDFAI